MTYHGPIDDLIAAHRTITDIATNRKGQIVVLDDDLSDRIDALAESLGLDYFAPEDGRAFLALIRCAGEIPPRT